VAVAAESLWDEPDDRLALSDLWELLRRPEWHKDANCREHPEVNFFPGKSESAVRAAKDVCSRCLVRWECRRFAESHPGTQGIWAGRVYG
jgi:hypothetical protein